MQREELLEQAKKKVQEELSGKDLRLMQAVKTLDDLDEAKSLLFERLREWFKLNFPSLELQNEESYCRVVAEFGAKEEFELVKLQEVVGEKKALELLQAAERGYGAPFDLQDRKAAKGLAKRILELYFLRKELEEYISFEAQRTLKNISYLSDPLFAARLVTTAGGLHRLAKMPASMIQVIGAEKALFRHLRTGSRPPKHGVLFQTALISTASPEKRGRLARALAGKLAIAAKADYYSHEFIAPKLKEQLETRIKDIGQQKKRKPEPVHEGRERKFSKRREKEFGNRNSFGEQEGYQKKPPFPGRRKFR